MKKIFLFAAALFTTAAMNATVGAWQSDGTAPAVGSTLVGSTITVQFNSLESGKTFGTEGAAYVEGVPEDMKSSGSKAVKLSSSSGLYIKVIPSAAGAKFVAGDTLYICGYNAWKVSSTKALSGDVAASITTGSDKNHYAIGYVVFQSDVDTLYLSRANSSTGISAFKIAAFVDPGTPMLNSDKDALDLRIERTGAESKVDSFVLSGVHLTGLSPLSITIPNYAGLSISSTSIVPAADGSLNAKYYVTYAPTAETDNFSGNIVVTAGSSIQFNIAVNCNKKVPQAALVPVGNTIAWDFTATGQSKDIVPYSTNDTIIFYNAAEGWASTFAADKLAGHAGNNEYMYRNDKGGYFQGKAIVFQASVAGKVTLTYSNTGNNATRTITINGTKVGSGSASQDAVLVSDYPVAAGMVYIGALDADDAVKAFRLFYIEFTKDATALKEAEVASPKAVKRMIDGQVVIEKGGKYYNLLGAEIEL